MIRLNDFYRKNDLYRKKALILCKFKLQNGLPETSGGLLCSLRGFFSIITRYSSEIVLPGFYCSLEKSHKTISIHNIVQKFI